MSFDSYIKPQLLTKTTKERMGCISFDSYIKPQLLFCLSARYLVVYLLIPTSNHNDIARGFCSRRVVYLLIPTSNHNLQIICRLNYKVVYLLIPTSNHNV